MKLIRARQINHTTETSFWGADGQPVTAEDFLKQLFDATPEFYKTEQELRDIWANPTTRKSLLEKLADAGYGLEMLKTLRQFVANPKSDIFDVLEYVSFDVPPTTREARAIAAESSIYAELSPQQRDFVEFVLSRYVDSGVEMLDREFLPELLKLKYDTLEDATSILGTVDEISATFTGFQKFLYEALAL